ncbi:alpha/beta hydrolase family protein [Streptomyces violens]|uniref:alpha/beta hydrolase family protein n=1 Tax=Streptomyces violens TaxID=66377 RepID=UPI0007C6CC47|nr:alpha/beta hydrolase [Streptomyces violens]
MRRGSVWAGVCGVLAAVCLTVPQGGRAVGAPDAAFKGTYSYGPQKRQTIGAYRTAGTDVRPVVMILHGGYWARDSDWSGWARKLAARGFVVFDVDYRLNTDARWHAQRTDALAALRWIRAQAVRFRADPRRIVLLGSSAGGQIAANTAEYTAGTAERPAGVIALSPVADPYLAWRDGARSGASAAQRRLRREAQKLAGCDPRKAVTCRAVWDDMAARTWAPGGPERPGGPGMPMLLMHFAHDFVPVAHSRGLAKAEPQATVSVLPGTGHGMKALTRPAVERRVLAWLMARVERSADRA